MEAESLEFELQFDRVQRVLLITMGTVITEESVVASHRAVHSFLEVEDPHSVIADLSLVERIEVPTDFVWRFSTEPRVLAAGTPCVLVANRDVVYGMSRMFQILRKVPSMDVVHSMNEALAMLGLQALEFERGASAGTLERSDAIRAAVPAEKKPPVAAKPKKLAKRLA